MNDQDRKAFEAMNSKLDTLILAVIGNESHGIKGLVKRQEEDEEQRRLIVEELGRIQRNQEEMLNTQNEHEQKITQMMVFYKVYLTLGRIKKKSVLIVGSLVGGLVWVATSLEKVKSFLDHLFHVNR